MPQVGGCLIGDDVEIGANCAIDRGRFSATKIGAGTKVDNLVITWPTGETQPVAVEQVNTTLVIRQAAAMGLDLPIIAGSAMHQPATAALLQPRQTRPPVSAS